MPQIESIIIKGASDQPYCSMQEWRPFRLLVDGQASGIRLSHLMKMRLAISHHFKGEGSNPEESAVFLDSIFSYLKEVWCFDSSGKTVSKSEAE